MKVTDFSRRAVAYRRFWRDLGPEWECVDDRGGALWELNRGKRMFGHRIVEVKIPPGGFELAVRIVKP